MTEERKTVDIIISDDLRNVLLEIQDSQVAQLLVKGTHFEDELADDHVNYISISKKDLTKISYLTKERYEGLSIEECWATTKRIMAKPGGFISKVFKNISEKEVEKFSTLFRSEITKPKLDFQVFEGDEIKKFYHYSSYCERNGGSLHASCMKYDNCQNFLEIYSKNPDNCKIVVLFDNDDATRIIGRAILWHIGEHKVMDRIYTINDESYQFYFKQWASKHGYYFKSEQNWFNTRQFEMLGSKKINLDLTLDLPNNKFDRVPYMDTFKFMDYEGKLYNFQPKGKEYYTLTDTGGRKNGYDHLVTDYITGVLRYRGDAIRLRYLEVEGGVRAHTHPDSCYYSEIMDTYILRDHAFQHPILKDYIFNEDFKSHNNEERIQERIKYVEEREAQRQKEREEREARRQRQLEGIEQGGYERGRLYSDFNDYADVLNQMRNLRHNFNTDEIYSYVSEYMDLRRRGYAGTLEDLVRERRNERVAPPIRQVRGQEGGRVIRDGGLRFADAGGFADPVVEEPVAPTPQPVEDFAARLRDTISTLAQPDPVEEEAQEEVTERVEEQPIITATQGEDVRTTGIDLTTLYDRYMTAENRIRFLPTDDSGTRFWSSRYYTVVDTETGEMRIEEGAE